MPAAIQTVSRPERGAKRAASEGSNRHHRDDESRCGRRHAPALDEQEDEQEERGDEPAREQEHRGVRAQGRPAGRRSFPSRPAAREEPRAEGARGNLHEEDRFPAERLGEDPSEQRGRARHRRCPPRPTRVRRDRRFRPSRQETERCRDEQRCADRLCDACADQDFEGRRKPASEGGGSEDQRPRREDRAWRSAGNEGGGQRDEREREVEGRQHPGDGGDVDVELAEHVGKRERDDRRIGERKPDRETDQARPHETSLEGMARRRTRSVLQPRAKYRSVARHTREVRLRENSSTRRL